jgi:flavin-dependent dehydrogenase
MFDYDAIVVGGGPAGTHTAMSIAKHSNQRLRVLLIDRNPKIEFGKKTLSGWSCGDAVSKRSIEYIQSHLGIRYGDPELEHYVKGVVAYSPDHQTRVLFEGEGYVLNRKVWPQKQAEYLEKFGVEVMYQWTARKLIAEDGFIRGVEATGPAGSVSKLRSKLVIDASGSASVLRTNLPIQSYIQREIDRDDIESTGRYILEFEPASKDETYFDPDYCLIHLDQYLAPGGYCLAPDTPVICKNSLKSVQEVGIGDEVLTSMGWMPVSGISIRHYTGYLVAVTPYMLNHQIKLTPEHLVRVWNPEIGETWKRAEDLIIDSQRRHRNRDYLVVPLPEPTATPFKALDVLQYVNGTVENGHIYEGINSSPSNSQAPNASIRGRNSPARHPKETEIPLQIPLTEEFLELCGWYISRGYIKGVHVTISNTDRELIQYVSELAGSLGFECSIWKSPRHGRAGPYYDLEIANPLLGELMARCFGSHPSNRTLPAWIHDISPEGKRALLKGIYSGDDSIAKGGKGRPDKHVYTTTSQALAVDLWLLLASIKIVASIRFNKKHRVWSLTIPKGQADLIGNSPHKAKPRRHTPYVVGERRVYLRVRKVEHSWYSGPVFDLNSAGDFTPLFNVHNCWTFPKGLNKVNIGLGVQKKALQRRNERFRENDSLKSLIDKYVKANPVLKDAKPASGPLDAGNTYNTWQVPVRRQNDCLVANGYAVVGDAAWMPRPIDAGGIGPALFASVILGRVAAEALEANDTSESGLWRYNTEYMAGYGSQMASFEILRRFLQNVTNDEINYGMKHFLTYEDIEKITLREHPGFGRVKLLNPLMLLRVLSHWRLASGLRYCVHKHRALVQLYSEYPENPAKFPEWHKRFLRELQEAYIRFP